MFLIILGILLLLLYFYIKKKHSYWEERNVKYVKAFPFIGNFWRSAIGLESFVGDLCNLYNAFPDERYVGSFQLKFDTILFIRDPDLIKQIMVKDFDAFSEHRLIVDEESDPLWGKNLFSSREQRWRVLRPTLSPTFTSSKMKMMYGLLKECVDEFLNHLLQQPDDGIITINLKETFRKYTNDVIASAAFGVKLNSFKNPNNDFYRMGKNVSNVRGLRLLKFLTGPKVNKLLGTKVFDKEVEEFFMNLIDETVKTRERNGTVRPDMIHLLMEARKGAQSKDDHASVDTGFATVHEETQSHAIERKKIDLNTTEIAAQALIFFIAGFEASSTLMAYAVHELAVNADVQERLREEVDEASEECENNVTYEKLMKMKYMDMVVCETLRKWPPTPIGDRLSNRRYTVPAVKPHESDLHLEPDTVVAFPIFPLHRDAKYYPDPERFDPERFSDENKHNIHPFAYIPFGAGPRNCIGSRFALMETKILIFHIVKHFSIEVVDKTPIRIKLSPEFAIVPIGGLWVGLKKRSTK